MTDEQFERLKHHLDASSKQTPSSLDKTILSAAKKQTNVVKEGENSDTSKGSVNKLKAYLFGLMQTTTAQSVFVSVVLTVFVFIGLALMIKPEQQNNEQWSESESKSIRFEFEPTNQSDSIVKNEKMILSSEQYLLQQKQIQMPTTQQGRDQVLAQMSLPDIPTLLDEMNISERDDHEFTKSLISIAMQDIRFMIDNQNLNEARVRYARLKQSCSSCPLPDSLEALMLMSSPSPT